jgi:hypothetical protein
VLQCFLVAIDDAHAHAKCRQLARRRETYTAGTAGDYRTAAGH